MKVCIIGMGEIGRAVYDDIHFYHDIICVDVKPVQGYPTTRCIPDGADIYIIAVYSTEQVLEVFEKLDYGKTKLVIIESTLKPGTMRRVLDEHSYATFVLFPHRYMGGDPLHRTLNLDRLMGSNRETALLKAFDFYSKLMECEKIHRLPWEIVEMAKPLENAMRFIEIALAENLKMSCDAHDIDFDLLRKAMNTKWNINIHEARDGIAGKCLSRDSHYIQEVLPDFSFLNHAVMQDDIYKERLK